MSSNPTYSFFYIKQEVVAFNWTSITYKRYYRYVGSSIYAGYMGMPIVSRWDETVTCNKTIRF